MLDDITLGEIKHTKKDIRSFADALKEISDKNAYEFSQSEEDFFAFISKQIIFMKNLYLFGTKKYFFQVLISDFYNYIISILQNNHRYIYLNERSIIENYMRCILNESVENNHITTNLFDLLKEKYVSCLSETEYSLLKSEYRTACGYVHGGKNLKDTLVFDFEECMGEKKSLKSKKKYYERIIVLIKVYNRILVKAYPEFISEVFHRRKTLLGYLLGNELLEYLFLVIKETEIR